MIEKSTRNLRLVGLVGAVVLAFVGGLIGASTKFAIGATTYTAQLEHAAGLRVGEDVQVAGVSVGKVRAIRLKGTHVEADFSVNNGVDLGRDTRVEVKVATILGTHFVAVTPAGGGDLEDRTIALDHTHVAYNLQDVVNKASGLATALDVKTISAALQDVARTMQATSDEVRPALVGISALSKTFAVRAEDIGTLLESTATFTDQLADNTGDITALMKQGNALIESLLSRREAIHNLLVDLRSIGTEMTALMQENRADVRPMITSLNGTIDLLERNHAELGRLVDLLGPAARYLANATGHGSWLELLMPGGVPDNLACVQTGSCS
jgi:phospholipid/cholesterol/gamma-HCH transport system substrate-binding protein